MPTRVMIVDDSRSIRRWLRFVLEQDERLEVVGEASCASEARRMLDHLQVDVMTLDVNMPGMSGLEFLSRLMIHHPLPVVMVSALTEAGSREAIEALSLGAVDCIEKPRSAFAPNVAVQICERVLQAAHTRVQPGAAGRRIARKELVPPPEAQWRGDVILIGASTGGVTALERVLREVDEIACPIVLAQHMPENFLRSFTRRLNENYRRRFTLAQDGMALEPGQAVIAIGKDVSTRLIRRTDGTITCALAAPSAEVLYRPSVDDLFLSAADAGLSGAAAVMTGMGDDGARGLLALRKAGFFTMTQNESTSVVYGMPRAAYELGAADLALSPDEIGQRIASRMKAQSAGRI
ncbi:chemotaxis-specific protein-glutamate methyltransferase CheB [Aliishimia ponticola]|nr:chemotaxis-specific protein-glutamate methyltransferase CheB [Aliishimia ponticola]